MKQPRRLTRVSRVLYIGRDVHKKAVSYCVKDVSCKIHAADTISATIGYFRCGERQRRNEHLHFRIQDHPWPHAAAVPHSSPLFALRFSA
jgi:hypothetical protein